LAPRGRGIALRMYKNLAAIVPGHATGKGPGTGKVSVTRDVSAWTMGLSFNPDGVMNQIFRGAANTVDQLDAEGDGGYDRRASRRPHRGGLPDS